MILKISVTSFNYLCRIADTDILVVKYQQ